MMCVYVYEWGINFLSLSLSCFLFWGLFLSPLPNETIVYTFFHQDRNHPLVSASINSRLIVVFMESSLFCGCGDPNSRVNIHRTSWWHSRKGQYSWEHTLEMVVRKFSVREHSNSAQMTRACPGQEGKTFRAREGTGSLGGLAWSRVSQWHDLPQQLVASENILSCHNFGIW